MIPYAVSKIEGHLILCDGVEYWCRTLGVYQGKTLQDCLRQCREVLEWQKERSLAHAAL